jgi:DNA-binding ferritin-like protein (Dps family)
MFGETLNRKVKDWLGKEIARLSDHLADGKAKDYADYRDRVGQIKALQATLKEITALENTDETQAEKRP